MTGDPGRPYVTIDPAAFRALSKNLAHLQPIVGALADLGHALHSRPYLPGCVRCTRWDAHHPPPLKVDGADYTRRRKARRRRARRSRR